MDYDPDKLLIITNDATLHIKPKEAELLELFLKAPNTIIDKKELLDRLNLTEGALRAQIKNLRKIIGKDRIETIKDVGYRFVSR